MARKRTDEEIDDEMGRAIADGTVLEGWERIDIKVSKSPRAVYGLRLSAEEFHAFSGAANARGMTLSDFLRSAARGAIDGEIDIERAAAVGTAREKARELTEALSRI